LFVVCCEMNTCLSAAQSSRVIQQNPPQLRR